MKQLFNPQRNNEDTTIVIGYGTRKEAINKQVYFTPGKGGELINN